MNTTILNGLVVLGALAAGILVYVIEMRWLWKDAPHEMPSLWKLWE